MTGSLHVSCFDGLVVIDYVAAVQEQHILQKQQLYRYNQIPAIVVGPPDLDKPNWDKDLYERLERMSYQTFDPMRYIPVPIEK